MRPRCGLAIGLVSLAVVVLGSLGFALVRNYQLRALPPRENLTVDQKHQQTRDAFSSTTQPASDAETKAISAALDRLNTALVQQSSAGVAKAFDADRLWDEVVRLGTFGTLPESQIAAAKTTFVGGLPSTIATQWTNVIWTSHKIARIELSANRQEAVVYDSEFHGVVPRRTVKGARSLAPAARNGKSGIWRDWKKDFASAPSPVR